MDGNELLKALSVRLDESGTDGRSPYTALAGAVATIQQWESLERAWDDLLYSRNVDAFHFKEFQERSGDFKNWSNLKHKRFAAALEKIIRKRTLFRVAVGVENTVHAEIKNRMKGIKGFRPDSHYGLCLRYLMFLACKNANDIDQDPRLTFMLEDGPWSAGAVSVYSRVSRMTSPKYRAARFAHLLSGISVCPKGSTRTLEAADYLVGVAHQRMLVGRFTRQHNPQVSILLTRPFLERWYQGMIEEKERRRTYRDERLK